MATKYQLYLQIITVSIVTYKYLFFSLELDLDLFILLFYINILMSLFSLSIIVGTTFPFM